MGGVGTCHCLACGLAEWNGQIKSGLSPRAQPVQRGVQGHSPEAAGHNQVAIRLEARGQGPIHVLVGVNVDVLIHHKYILDVGAGADQGRQRIPRLARITLPDGYPQD